MSSMNPGPDLQSPNCRITDIICPSYVSLGGTALEYHSSDMGGYYYRVCGDWACNFRFENGTIYAVLPEMPWIHDKVLIPISKEEHDNDNGI